ncbi:unnamed protein product [Musa acuminata var. zebrina]
MDSANSSSLHSSSGGGGDDEFDSRTGSFSAFFHSSTATSASAASALRPAPPPSSSYPRSHHFLDSLSSIDSTPLLPPSPAAMASHGVGFGKRSRASRRAPTTVLTTDTSNFRAMVQEFTGIPSPPFAASPSSSFARARLDLFHSATAFRSCSDPPPPVSSFLFPRPFMQLVLSPSLVPISSASSANASATISNAIAATSNTISNAHSTTSNSINPSSSNSYQLPSSSEFNAENVTDGVTAMRGEGMALPCFFYLPCRSIHFIMSKCGETSHLRCEIRVGRLSNFDLDLPGNPFIRYYVFAGHGRRIRIDTKEVIPTGNPCWDELATIECQGSSDPVRELLEPHTVVFELRRRSRRIPLLGRFTGSKLLGMAEVAWKEVLASPDMSLKRCVRFASLSSEFYGLKPPCLSVEMKVEAVKSLSNKQRSGRRPAMEGCACRSSERFGSEEDILLAAATLNVW